MAESTADSTAANADALRVELKKTMTEILDDGGVSKDRGKSDGRFGALKPIDEAIRILNSLREVESKKPKSDIPSSSSPSPKKVEVPKEFTCMLSHDIMNEPVVIASGQTYERRYITQWLKFKLTCPKTKEVLSHRVLSPNHLIDELITQWCRVNKYDRSIPSHGIAIGLFSDDIDLLLQRLSSPSSVEELGECANELRRQTKRFDNVRALFVAEVPDSITRLLTPLSALGEAIDSNPKLQKNIITALLYISSCEKNKVPVAQNPLAIPLLTKSLKQGTDKTKRNSAEALFKLSDIDSNKSIVGNSKTLKALIDVINEGDYSAAMQAAAAVFRLCSLLENREKAVSEGLIPVLINKIKAGSNANMCFGVLSFMTTHNGVIEEMEDLGFIDDLFSILRNPSFSVTDDDAVAIVLGMYGLNTGDKNRDRTRLKAIDEEENKYETFSKLAKQGSRRAVKMAEAILQCLQEIRDW